MIKVNINKVLEHQNKSMYLLAKETELSYSALHKLVNNNTKSISFDTLEKICTSLNVGIEEVLQIVPDN